MLQILCQPKSTWLGWYEEKLGGYKQTFLWWSQLVWILVWVFIITNDLQTPSVAISRLSRLKVDLTSIVDFLISLANRLVDLRSTQPNESVNNTVASKTPKSTFYSGSKYNGHQYVLHVKWKIRFILEVLLPFHRNLLKLWKIFQLHLLHEFVMINCEILQVHKAMLLFRYDAQT